jgi:type IV secretion system protein VirB4
MLETLVSVPSAYITCPEWQRLAIGKVRREIRSRRRHFFNKRTSLVNYFSPQAKVEEMLVDDSATAVVHELGQSLTAMDVHGHVFGSGSFSVVLHDLDPARLDESVAACANVVASHDGVLHDERYNLLDAVEEGVGDRDRERALCELPEGLNVSYRLTATTAFPRAIG